VQSSVFNLSIMIATWFGGALLTRFPDSGVKGIVIMSLVCFILSSIIAFLSRRTLRSSPVSSFDEGIGHEEVHQRADLPAAR
jgi:predicted MFS family arabinose efflux permease